MSDSIETYDAIIVGGGHNGLVAAAYLARSGARTVVLESRASLLGVAHPRSLPSGCMRGGRDSFPERRRSVHSGDMRSLHAFASLVVSGLLLLPACSHPKSDVNEEAPKADGAKSNPATVVEPPPAPEPAAAPEPAPAPAADAVVKELRLRPSELTEIADGAKLEHCLDCKRQASTYNYCEFDKSAFWAAIGDANPDEQLSLSVQMVHKSDTNHVPDDPNAPQPHGGFTYVRHDCRVDAVLPSQ